MMRLLLNSQNIIAWSHQPQNSSEACFHAEKFDSQAGFSPVSSFAAKLE